MTIQLGILGSATGVYVRDLMRAASELGVMVHLLSYAELQASIGPFGEARVDSKAIVATNCDNKPASQSDSIVSSPTDLRLDGLIVRTMPLGSLEQVIFRMDCLQVWQSVGVEVINTPRCLETSIDKWLTLHRLKNAGILVPPTVACQTRDQGLEAMELLGGDVLVKPLFGGEGRGIVRLQDRDLAWRAISTLSQLGHVLYLQQFLPNFGYDIRVLIIGDQLLSVRRYAADGHYRSNISQGGIAQPHELTDQERELAIKASSSVDGLVVGVDLLPACDGNTYVLEVNAVPGWKGVASSLSIDVANLIIQYSVDRIQRAGKH